MSNGFLNISWAVWGVLALLVALVFVFVVPRAEQVQAATGLQFFILRWFHSLCWLLIGVNFFLRATGNESLSRLADPVAAAGGILYLMYMVNFVTLR